MISRAAVVINAGAGMGTAEDLRKTIDTALADAGTAATFRISRTGLDLRDLAHAALTERPEVVVAAGGDGTVNAVASVIAGTDVALGVLPLGTLNHFARDVNIPRGLPQALQVLVDGQETRVDVGDVNGRVFVNNSSLGFYPRLVRIREGHRRMGKRKSRAMIQSIVSVLRRYPLLRVRISVDGQEFHGATPFVFVTNNEYDMEGLHLGARRSLCSGLLNAYVMHPIGRLGLLRLSVSTLLGRLRRERGYDTFRTRELWIEAEHRHPSVALDGEVAQLKSPLHYRSRPGALRVIVQAPPPDGR